MVGMFLRPTRRCSSAAKLHTENGLPFKIVTGHGAFVLPIRNRVSTLTLAMQESEVAEECVTKQGIALLCRSVIAFKVGDDHESIANAARRFLEDQDHMSVLTGRIFAGHLRSIIGSMTVEEIIRERQRLAEVVLDASKPEMEKIGLVVDSLQIQSIDDRGSGYIAALAAPIKPRSSGTPASPKPRRSRPPPRPTRSRCATRPNTNARPRSPGPATKPRSTGPRPRPPRRGRSRRLKSQAAVLQAQRELAVRNAELKEKELVASVEKPAEAEAFRIRTIAEAEAQRTRLQAEATATGQGIALQRMLVEKMPEIIAAAASELANANVTVLNGADGMGQLLAGLAGQAGQLMKLVQNGVNDSMRQTALPGSDSTADASQAAEPAPERCLRHGND